jgi:hypothetical protein
MQGASNYLNIPFKVAANFDWHRAKPRREFVRVRLGRTITPMQVNQYPKQGSDVLNTPQIQLTQFFYSRFNMVLFTNRNSTRGYD